MSRTYRGSEKPKWAGPWDQVFRCRHCRKFVGELPSGGRQRNHCPFCLYSRHVDHRRPGDRASVCGGSMAPIGTFSRPNGEQVIVHRCWECGRVRHNRMAADDDWALVMRLLIVARPADAAERSA